MLLFLCFARSVPTLTDPESEPIFHSGLQLVVVSLVPVLILLTIDFFNQIHRQLPFIPQKQDNSLNKKLFTRTKTMAKFIDIPVNEKK